MKETAGYQIHKGSEKERIRNNDLEGLANARNREAEIRKTKPMKYVWDNLKKAYILTPQ